MRYYLAYGSNLNKAQMRYRCPGAKPVGTAIIYDYELLFKGSQSGAYFTIEPKVGEVVPVGVWEVTDADIAKLDIYEGFPRFYYKKEMRVALTPTKGRKREVDAFVYIMHEERSIGIPSAMYVATCLEGYDDFGFDPDFIDAAYDKSILATKARRVI